MKPNNDIESNNVTIEQAIVSINLLQITKKQMTLAVFRQLPKLNDSFDYFKVSNIIENHDRWGIVNYEIKHQGRQHLVINVDGKLYRHCIDDWSDEWKDSIKFDEMPQLFIAV